MDKCRNFEWITVFRWRRVIFLVQKDVASHRMYWRWWLCCLCFVLKVISRKTQWSYQLLYLFIYLHIYGFYTLSSMLCWIMVWNREMQWIGRGCCLICGTAIAFAWIKWQKPQKTCQDSNSLYLDLNLIPLFTWNNKFYTCIQLWAEL